ncbi:hypothetical protein JBKA6_1181 [Ichthyobacterium seriolicida]|uniref:Outer membrane protein beta-barrel domain-containing protein n=2 Tax=Ichthyobacterium seriolicida TaxID=242600 RepID=A0A1J1DZ55_9FLAO|nr:hypothetical protein JBKA6_1181 [Ichthyobacterium seriolicida]
MISGGGGFASNAYLLNMRYFYGEMAFYKNSFELEFSIFQHEKEIKTNSIYQGDISNRFVYGKLNDFLSFRIGWGRIYEIIPKREVGSVSIEYILYGGFSLGVLVPVYLEIAPVPFMVKKEEEKNIERYDPLKHDYINIIRDTSFFNGISESVICPGTYIKGGLVFDWHLLRKKITSLEVGAVIDYFFKEIPMMHLAKNYSYFAGFYITFNFGTKWN